MNYLAKEADVENIVLDFINFCDFIDANQPRATSKRVLPTKACYEINRLFNYPEKNAKPTDRFNKYASVSMWFYIAQEAGLLWIDDTSRQSEVFCMADSYSIFREMSVFSQYMLLFYTWCCFVNPEVQYGEKGTKHVFVKLFDDVFAEFGEYGSSEWIEYDENNNSAIQIMMKSFYKAAHSLRNLGLITFTESMEVSKHYNTPIIEKIKATDFGYQMMKVCKFSEYNGCMDVDPVEEAAKKTQADIEKMLDGIEKKKEGFFTLFSDYFPRNSINTKAIDTIIYGLSETNTFENADMGNIFNIGAMSGADDAGDAVMLEFKVALKKNCYRIIRCSSKHTFEDLHLAIQRAFNFDNDHLYSFFLDGQPFSHYSVNARYSEEPPYTDEVCLKEARFYDKQHILYLFDYGDEWSFDITVTVIPDIKVSFKSPEIVKSVGKAPRQY